MNAAASSVPAPTEVHVESLPFERFQGVVSDEDFRQLERDTVRARQLLDGRIVWNVNSTARGGGVAEMLVSLLAYARGSSVDARWMVIGGDPEFFAITKRIHNRLHGFPGDGGSLGKAEREHYEATLEINARRLGELIRPRDAVILHDPQTAGLVPALRTLKVPVVWRCHVGLDEPNELAREAWRFLAGYVTQADFVVFSRRAFAWDDIDPARLTVIPPSIDAFSPKNVHLDEETAESILHVAGLRDDVQPKAPPQYVRINGEFAEVARRARVTEVRPLRRGEPYVLQVSRWDALKDPAGVVTGFAEHVAPHHGHHLVYAGPDLEAVADDPEGVPVLREARELWERLPPPVRERVHLALLPMVDGQENAAIVNALQTRADVVVQKSLAEGFGLTVAEAMWKARPVVASRIGGIQDQIEHGRSGLLLDDPRDLAAYGRAVCELIADPARARAIGEAGQARVRERFLGLHSLIAYVKLLNRLLKGAQA